MGNTRNFLLYPFSILFRLVTDIRNRLYDSGILKSAGFNIPIICVGNITVGGTGKTPHTEYLIDTLKDKSKVAVLSRGYKRSTKGFRIATSASTTREVGDEPLQIKRKFPEIVVAVDADRVRGVKAILGEFSEIDVIILDDGFQHRRIKPGLSILLTDFRRLISRDYLLPYGNLREGARNAIRADIIIVTKSPPGIRAETRARIAEELKLTAGQRLFFTSLTNGDARPVFKEVPGRFLSFSEEDKGRKGALLITGIAEPKELRTYLGNYFGEIKHIEFSDHHRFSKSDLIRIIKYWEALEYPEKYIKGI
jgi:tetraacyldisaccharide 4'-kinase